MISDQQVLSPIPVLPWKAQGKLLLTRDWVLMGLVLPWEVHVAMLGEALLTRVWVLIGLLQPKGH